jgi:AraC-like DNA-binding protein
VKTAGSLRIWRDRDLGASGIDLLAGAHVVQKYDPHFHDEFVIAAYSGGSKVLGTDRQVHLVGEGCVLVLAPGQSHTARPLTPSGWSYRAMYPDLDSVTSVARDVLPCGTVAHEFRPCIVHDERQSRRLFNAMQAIEVERDDPLARAQLFAEAMACVFRQCLAPGVGLRTPKPEQRAVQASIEYARARFTDSRLLVQHMADAANLSQYYFMRSFRRTAGLSVHQYVVQLRVNEAKRLLAQGARPADIAADVGFADQAHLTRKFRALVGVPPGVYARMIRQAGPASAKGLRPARVGLA